MPSAGVLAALAAIALVAAVARLSLRTWLHPGAFFALWWLFFIVFSMSGPLFGVERYPVWHGALWWIALVLACVYVGGVVGTRVADAPAQPARIPSAGRNVEGVVLLLVAAAVSTVVYIVLGGPFLPFGEKPPLTLQLLLGVHYIGAPVAGALFGATRERPYRLLSIAVLVLGACIGVLGAGRTSVVMQFTHWFAGYGTMLVFAGRGRAIPLFTPWRVCSALVSLGIVVTLAVVLYNFRAVPAGTPATERLRRYEELLEADRTAASWKYMQPGIFGQVAMFSAYFQMAWADPPTVPRFPQETAAGIYRALGYEPAEPLYLAVGDMTTNIFTTFKPAIEDFTMPGSLLVFFVWGGLSGWAYRRLQLGSLWPAGVLIFFYAHTANPGGMYLSYNSLTGAFLIVGAYCWYLEAFGSLRPGRISAGHDARAGRSWTPFASARAVWSGTGQR